MGQEYAAPKAFPIAESGFRFTRYPESACHMNVKMSTKHATMTKFSAVGWITWDPP
jgi:hypothetical protein